MGAAAAVLCAWQRAAPGGGRPLRRRASRVLRHRDLRLGDAARSRLGAVQQDHGRAVRHPDGRRAARPRPPPADAGVLVAADRAVAREHHRRSSTACSTRSRRTAPSSTRMQDLGAHLVVDALLTPWWRWIERRKAIFVAFHDLIPGTTYVKPGESWAPELPPGVRSHHGRDQGHHRGAARQPALRTSSAISSTRATPATSSTSASCSTRFSASAAPRCRRRAAPPAARSICSTPTTTSASS